MIFLLLMLCSGCAVQSTQADIVRGAISRDGEFDANDFAWKMTFNGQEALVYAVNVGDGIVFANRDGLQIGFDGWDVALVSGMRGALGDIGVVKPGPEPEDPGIRIHRVAGLGEFEVDCPPPERSAFGWRTECTSVDDGTVYRMTHRVGLDASGAITRIESHLLPGAAPMTLTPVAQ